MFNKQLLLFLIVSLSLNGLFGYLSYHFYGVKQGLKAELVQCQASSVSLEKSMENHKEICKIQDSISAECKKEEQQVEKDVDASVAEIDKMIIKSHTTSNVGEHNEKDSTLNLDTKLPDSLVRVLSENCLRAKGSSCSHP